MKTNDSIHRYFSLRPQTRYGAEPNEEQISNRWKEKNYFFENLNICQYYGQTNIEKCIFLLFIQITFTSTLLYHFFTFMYSVLLYTIISTIFADSITWILYSFFLYSLRSEEIFNKVSHLVIKINDFIIVFNSIVKTLSMVLITLSFLGWGPLMLFAGKFALDIYFMVVSVKLFLFCPGARYVQEQSENIWSFVKLYLFCCEVEQEQENTEYTKIEDIESFY